jgi:hypothetical protein
MTWLIQRTMVFTPKRPYQPGLPIRLYRDRLNVDSFVLVGRLERYGVFSWVSPRWVAEHELMQRIRQRLERPNLNPTRLPL